MVPIPVYEWVCPIEACQHTWREYNGFEDPPPECCEKCGADGPNKVFHMPYIAAAALPNKKGAANVRRIDAKEAGWDKDMPAYKRLRANGIQPRNIDGSARLEQGAHTKAEIEMGQFLGENIKQVKERMAIADDMGLPT